MKRTIIVMIIIIMLSITVSARDWYVNNQAGNCDDNGAGTLAVPLCTISSANTRHIGGDTVYIMPGEYRETLYPKSGTGPTGYTVYSGYGTRDNVHILGSNDLSGGWTKCSAADPNCQGISDHIYYKQWTSEAKRVAFYRMDGGEPDCYDYFVDYAYYRCSETRPDGVHTDIPSKYETDCWEDREGWYMRADLDDEYNPRLSTLKGVADLIEPGMFYYDHDYDTPGNSRLYVWPFDDDDANNHQIECSQRRVAPWSQFDDPPYGPLNYVTLQNVSLTHSLVNGINLHAGTQFLTVQDCELAYNSGQGTAGENPSAILKNSASGLQDGIKILRNEIHHQGSDKGPGLLYSNWHSGLASTLYSVENTLIEGNHFHHLAEGVYVKHGGAGSTISYQNVTFKDNIMHDIAYHAISFGSGGDANTYTGTIEGNILYNIWDTSFEGGAIDTRIHNNNVKIYGNTIFNTSSRGIGIEVGHTPGSGHEIYNNLILDMQTIGVAGSFISLYSGTVATALSDYNMYYLTEGVFGMTAPGNVWSTRTTYGTLADWQSATNLDQHSQYIDPQVTNMNGYDFSLTDDSPAIDAGRIIDGYHCTEAGVETTPGCRMWYGSAPDIGAIEFTGPTPPCTDGATRSCTTPESCAGTQTCSSSVWGACIDTPDDGCPAAGQTCAQQSGSICTVSQTCSRSWLTATDSNMCCSGACEDPANPDCPSITVDSTYDGYTAEVIDDAVIDAMGGQSTTWASGESALNPHWVELTFCDPVDMNSIDLYWAWNPFRNEYATSQQVNVQYRLGEQWTDLTSFESSEFNVASTTISFNQIQTDGLRFEQPANQGSPNYTSVMWLTEVDYGLQAGSSTCGSADLNGDDMVEISEIIYTLNRWYSSAIDLPELIQTIKLWKDGC